MDQPKSAPPPLPLKLSPQGIRGYLETRACIKQYVSVLEEAAAEKDKNAGALAAIAATITFLMALKIPNHLRAPFVELRNIIQRERGVEKPLEQRQLRDVWDSAVVSLLHDDGMSLAAAVVAVVGRDPSAGKTLKTFRERLTRKTGPKDLREQYFNLMREFKQLHPKDTGKRALKASRAMRGKKL